ncbi:hypothetical protein [Microvirga massiliensis]|uniref:hypothetical protein n=1 Tax=Microvirga massiliensis TaxID=1033741 RepID=UPI00062B8749|nr:hypothetical protein [Microvirga massiliensis]
MKEASHTQGIESIFVIVFALLGGAMGWTVGYGLGDVVSHPRLLAILAAVSAVAIVGIACGFLGRSLPGLFPIGSGGTVPRAVWIGGGLSVLLGALAGHDLSHLVGLPVGWAIGLVSGTLATLGMAVLMVLYQHGRFGKESGAF